MPHLKAYITTATTTQVISTPAKRVLITVNTALASGTITVIDGTTGTTANVAVITNPGVGASFEYWDFGTGVRIVTNAICDITVNASSN